MNGNSIRGRKFAPNQTEIIEMTMHFIVIHDFAKDRRDIFFIKVQKYNEQ